MTEFEKELLAKLDLLNQNIVKLTNSFYTTEYYISNGEEYYSRGRKYKSDKTLKYREISIAKLIMKKLGYNDITQKNYSDYWMRKEI